MSAGSRSSRSDTRKSSGSMVTAPCSGRAANSASVKNASTAVCVCKNKCAGMSLPSSQSQGIWRSRNLGGKELAWQLGIHQPWQAGNRGSNAPPAPIMASRNQRNSSAYLQSSAANQSGGKALVQPRLQLRQAASRLVRQPFLPAQHHSDTSDSGLTCRQQLPDRGARREQSSSMGDTQPQHRVPNSSGGSCKAQQIQLLRASMHTIQPTAHH